MASDLVEIVHSLRMQMGQRGGASLSSLALAFRINDLNKSEIFDFSEFESIIAKVRPHSSVHFCLYVRAGVMLTWPTLKFAIQPGRPLLEAPRADEAIPTLRPQQG